MRRNLETLDTNVLIRYLVNDVPSQTKDIESLFKRAKPNSLFIPDIVIAEIIYVLLSYYSLSKKEIIGKVSILIDFDKFYVDKLLIKTALDNYSANNISFVDAYLVALKETGRTSKVHTFDKYLRKLVGNP